MENPAHWNLPEKVIYKAFREWEEAQANGIVGGSYVAAIAGALRDAGLLLESPSETRIGRSNLPDFYMLKTLVEKFGFDESELDSLVAEKRVIRLDNGSGPDLYPQAQFDELGNTPDELPQILAALDAHFEDDDGWTAVYWLTGSATFELGSVNRFEWLRRNGPKMLLEQIEEANEGAQK